MRGAFPRLFYEKLPETTMQSDVMHLCRWRTGYLVPAVTVPLVPKLIAFKVRRTVSQGKTLCSAVCWPSPGARIRTPGELRNNGGSLCENKKMPQVQHIHKPFQIAVANPSEQICPQTDVACCSQAISKKIAVAGGAGDSNG